MCGGAAVKGVAGGPGAAGGVSGGRWRAECEELDLTRHTRRQSIKKDGGASLPCQLQLRSELGAD
jgi:hypothetical protein